MQTVLLQPCYILHTRAYRDTSLLVEIFSRDHGRLSAVARSARGPKSRFKGLFQQFVPLLLSWQGRTELMNLTAAEGNGVPHYLSGEALLCGIYLNELLMRLLHRHDAHAGLFTAYQQALVGLQQNQQKQITLRLFEKRLLLELGYALQLDKVASTGSAIIPEQNYYFDPIQGLIPAITAATKSNVFLGESLLALHYEEFNNSDYLRDAKRLLRLAITSLLDNKPLKSRELFMK
jgi:DNA repair protein RecO (recombination protein O)